MEDFGKTLDRFRDRLTATAPKGVPKITVEPLMGRAASVRVDAAGKRKEFYGPLAFNVFTTEEDSDLDRYANNIWHAYEVATR